MVPVTDSSALPIQKVICMFLRQLALSPRDCSDILRALCNGQSTYLLLSPHNPVFSFIGESENVGRRLMEHNTGHGVIGTANPSLRPFFIGAFITYVPQDITLRQSLGGQWQQYRLNERDLSIALSFIQSPIPQPICGVKNANQFGPIRFITVRDRRAYSSITGHQSQSHVDASMYSGVDALTTTLPRERTMGRYSGGTNVYYSPTEMIIITNHVIGLLSPTAHLPLLSDELWCNMILPFIFNADKLPGILAHYDEVPTMFILEDLYFMRYLLLEDMQHMSYLFSAMPRQPPSRGGTHIHQLIHVINVSYAVQTDHGLLIHSSPRFMDIALSRGVSVANITTVDGSFRTVEMISPIPRVMISSIPRLNECVYMYIMNFMSKRNDVSTYAKYILKYVGKRDGSYDQFHYTPAVEIEYMARVDNPWAPVASQRYIDYGYNIDA